MEGNVSRFVRIGAGILGLVIVGWVMASQAAPPVVEGLPTDWTHRHVIFSRPGTAEEVARAAGDIRYWQQWNRLNVARTIVTDGEASPDAARWGGFHGNPPQSQIQRDWSERLGALGTAGAGNFPAKYSFGINTANCASAANPDFVVFSTGLPGSATQASIIAFDNLYSGCTSPPAFPNTYWAYNTGGQILTSPVFSRDGSQIAFVQTSAGAASLVLLKWQASTTETVALPGTPLSVTPALYPTATCVVPCMTTIALKSGGGTATNDTLSSVYYDYGTDTAWVGDASGWLHQFGPVFNGTALNPPAEIRTSPWPVQVNTTTPNALNSPIHDISSRNVFVGDQGGFLYAVSASTGAVTKSVQVDFGPTANNFVSGPILDRITETLYVFSSNDGTTACPGTVPCSGVFEFPANFTGATTPTEAQVGSSSAAPNPLYDGSFDSNYYASENATGNLYVCGDTGVNPILYRVPIAAGLFGTPRSVAAVTAAANHRICAPITDLLNPNGATGPEERVFFSVVANGHPTVCAGGCALSFVSMQWNAGTAYQLGQEVLASRANGLFINTVVQAGMSGGTAPTWPAGTGTIINDGSVKWINQGAPTFTALAAWLLNHPYAFRARIIDSNGNVEIATVGGTSGAAAPTWATTVGGTTSEGPSVPQLTWTNAGPLPSAALAEAGGTSGIIIDNTVGTLAGASQLYFTSLTNENCSSAPASGCAVQASQSALK